MGLRSELGETTVWRAGRGLKGNARAAMGLPYAVHERVGRHVCCWDGASMRARVAPS